jgi:hypothetical protein
MDARDKAVKAARNRVWEAVTKVGRELEEGENAAPGKKILSFTDTKGLATGETGVHRVEVTPAVYDAVTRFHQGLEGRPQSAAKRALRGVGSVATRAQIGGMPVEATSHMNTLASVVASVPGEKDVAGKALAAIPGQGAKAAAIREMLTIDFADPATRALENRLADAGALRIEADHGGLINSSHPRPLRARRRRRARPPGARAEAPRPGSCRDERAAARVHHGEARQLHQGELRRGHERAAGDGRVRVRALPGGADPDVDQGGRRRVRPAGDEPRAARARRGEHPLPRARRPPGGRERGERRVITGHSTFSNEKGHDLDVDTGLYAVDGTIKHLSPAEAQQLGDKAAPLYIPGGTLNPVAVGGLRSSGLRALLLSDRGTSGARPTRCATSRTPGSVRQPRRTVPLHGAHGQGALRRARRRLHEDRRRRLQQGPRADPAREGRPRPGESGRARLRRDGRRRPHPGQALEHGDAPFGGAGAAAAKTAEFLMPRILTPGVGGRTNEQSVAARDQREYKDAMTDYTRRVRNANTPKDALAVIDEAVDDARSDGRFDPEQIRRELRKAIMLGPDPSDDDLARLEANAPQRRIIGSKRREIGTERTERRIRIRPTSNR